MKLLIINGPNLQLLGTREPEIYGTLTLDQINAQLKKTAANLKGVSLEFFQSNHEGDILDKIGTSRQDKIDGIILNPAAFSHTSYAIYDAVKASATPVIEVHLSNIYNREDFRKHSITAAAALGVISGLGVKSYECAIFFLADYIKNL